MVLLSFSFSVVFGRFCRSSRLHCMGPVSVWGTYRPAAPLPTPSCHGQFQQPNHRDAGRTRSMWPPDVVEENGRSAGLIRHRYQYVAADGRRAAGGLVSRVSLVQTQATAWLKEHSGGEIILPARAPSRRASQQHSEACERGAFPSIHRSQFAPPPCACLCHFLGHISPK